MSLRLRIASLVACAAAAVGCSLDVGVAPYLSGGTEPGMSRVATWEVIPATVELEPGASVRLTVIARDELGRTLNYAGAVTYKSADPEIAVVSSGGFVTGVGPGLTVISATVYLDGVTTSRSATARVGQPGIVDTVALNLGKTVILTFGRAGWEIPVMHLPRGSTVEWHVAAVSGGGTPNHHLWVMDAFYHTLADLDISAGIASRVFTEPGTYRYCTGACWDSWDYALLIVE